MTRAEPLGYLRTNGRHYWMFAGQFWWEDDGYTTEQITALLLERMAKHQRRIDAAMARLDFSEEDSSSGREPIPDDVKMFVWRRDGGRCVKCGSESQLEFDHIIPLAKGGSNTARNIQLLCEECNRAKGADLA